MSKNILSVNEKYFDALKEVANIGAGNAVSALSHLLNTKINMNVVKMKIEQISDVSQMYAIKDQYVVANLIEITENLRAVLLLLLEEESAKEIIKRVLGKNEVDILNLDEVEHSLICELGNILGGNYINAIGTFMGFSINQTTPQVVVDMVEAIISMLVVEFCDEELNTLIVDTVFEDESKLLKGTYLLVIDSESSIKIIETIEKYYA